MFKLRSCMGVGAQFFMDFFAHHEPASTFGLGANVKFI